jgi:hypothetical protein
MHEPSTTLSVARWKGNETPNGARAAPLFIGARAPQPAPLFIGARAPQPARVTLRFESRSSRAALQPVEPARCKRSEPVARMNRCPVVQSLFRAGVGHREIASRSCAAPAATRGAETGRKSKDSAAPPRAARSRPAQSSFRAGSPLAVACCPRPLVEGLRPRTLVARNRRLRRQPMIGANGWQRWLSSVALEFAPVGSWQRGCVDTSDAEPRGIVFAFASVRCRAFTCP